jgi:hypothetical protein
VISARTRSDKGSSVTSRPVLTRTPRSSKCRTRASVRVCAPPRRIGQPLACPAAIIVKPTAAEAVVSNGRMEWVETPAKRDRARSPAKWEGANDSAGNRADRPKRASTNGLPGICRMGPRNFFDQSSEVRNYGYYQRSVCFAVTCIQLVDCFFNRVFKHDCGPVIQRVSECRVRLNPRNGEGKRTIERACSAQGVCRRAQVVKKTRLCDLGG